MPEQMPPTNRTRRAAFIGLAAFLAFAVVLLIVVRVVAARSCRIHVINDDGASIVRITVEQAGQTTPVVVLVNVPAQSTVEGKGRLESGVESFATVETSAGTAKASLGTITGARIKQAFITVKGGKVDHVHYE